MGLNTDGHVLYSHDSGSCIWRKREGCWAHEAWRGPRGMRMLLNLWPGGVPPSIVPSEERSGSYARPAERFDLRETYNEVTVPSDGAAPVVAPKSVVEPDAFNPRRICDRAWKHGFPLPGGRGTTRSLKEIYMECEGKLPEELWCTLEREFLAERKTIKHDLAHLAALARADSAVAKLEAVQQTRSIDKAVDAYVHRKLPSRKNGKGKSTDNVNHTHLVEVLLLLALAGDKSIPCEKKLKDMRKCYLVQMVFERANLAAAAPQGGLQRFLQPAPDSAAAAATAAAAPTPAAAATASAPVAAAAAATAATARATAAPLATPAARAAPPAALTAAIFGSGEPSDLAREVETADEEAEAHREAADAALRLEASRHLKDDGGIAERVEGPRRGGRERRRRRRYGDDSDE